MTDKKPVLSVENLTVKLPDHADRLNAIEEVSFDVRPNEILCVVGESGSGKSVTAHTVMGLLPPKQLKPTAGRILLQGENLFEKRELDSPESRGYGRRSNRGGSPNSPTLQSKRASQAV